MFKKEIIWANEKVFRRFPKNIARGCVSPPEWIFDFYKDKKTWKYENDLSVSRQKHCLTPEEARDKANYNPKNKWIVSIISCDIRNKCESHLLSSPSINWSRFNKDNSHSSIVPIEWRKSIMSNQHKYLIYKQTLARNSKWEIK